jgi:peptidyl-tRNA hydrolase
MEHLSSADFNRLRIGIGRPQGATEAYVLAAPSAEEQALMAEGLMRVWPLPDALWAGDMAQVMCHLHGDHKGT